MTIEQKMEIANMRSRGFSFLQIAEALSLNINTVKSYCRRYKIDVSTRGKCKNCGVDIFIRFKCKPRQYCSDKCRLEWWNKHHIAKKTIYHLECSCCGKPFTTNGNKQQKYCSRECYIKTRFGGC